MKTDNTADSEEDAQNQTIRRSTRIRREPDRGDYITYATFGCTSEPADFSEAINSIERDKWIKAISEEHDSLLGPSSIFLRMLKFYQRNGFLK